MLQRASPYVSDVSLDYDRQREAYIGEVLSRGITHRVESPIRDNVEYTLESILNQEYSDMINDIDRTYIKRPDVSDITSGIDRNLGLDVPNHMDAWIEFDETQGLYKGSVSTLEGVKRMESLNRSDVIYEIEALLRQEYMNKEQEILRINNNSMNNTPSPDSLSSLGAAASSLPSASSAMGVGSSSLEYKIDSHRYLPEDLDVAAGDLDREEAEKEEGGGDKGRPSGNSKSEGQSSTRSYKAMERPSKKMKLGTFAKLAMAGMTLSQSGPAGLIAETILLSAVSWFSNLDSIWNKQPKQQIFACYFGGILIVATSKAMLKKKLTFQRNKRIQRIMMNVRYHNKERENASSIENISKAAKRLKGKKKNAMKFKPNKWIEKVSSPQGLNSGWQGRAISLKTRMKEKKANAKARWVTKLC